MLEEHCDAAARSWREIKYTFGRTRKRLREGRKFKVFKVKSFALTLNPQTELSFSSSSKSTRKRGNLWKKPARAQKCRKFVSTPGKKKLSSWMVWNINKEWGEKEKMLNKLSLCWKVEDLNRKFPPSRPVTVGEKKKSSSNNGSRNLKSNFLSCRHTNRVLLISHKRVGQGGRMCVFLKIFQWRATKFSHILHVRESWKVAIDIAPALFVCAKFHFIQRCHLSFDSSIILNRQKLSKSGGRREQLVAREPTRGNRKEKLILWR